MNQLHWQYTTLLKGFQTWKPRSSELDWSKGPASCRLYQTSFGVIQRILCSWVEGRYLSPNLGVNSRPTSKWNHLHSLYRTYLIGMNRASRSIKRWRNANLRRLVAVCISQDQWKYVFWYHLSPNAHDVSCSIWKWICSEVMNERNIDSESIQQQSVLGQMQQKFHSCCTSQTHTFQTCKQG